MCTHNETGMFYIGYRERNVKLGRPAEIDLPKYKTSSKEVKQNFNDYNWSIVAEFFTGNDAYDFEQKLISENWDDPLLINRHCFYNKERFKPTNPHKAPWNKNKLCPRLSRDPWNKGQTGLTVASAETKQKLRDLNLGKIVSAETRSKQSQSMFGKNKGNILGSRSEEFKNKLRVSKPKLVTRLIDKKEMAIANFIQWNNKQDLTNAYS